MCEDPDTGEMKLMEKQQAELRRPQYALFFLFK